jgi:hypothetical protein
MFKPIVNFFKGLLESIEYTQMKRIEVYLKDKNKWPY